MSKVIFIATDSQSDCLQKSTLADIDGPLMVNVGLSL